MAATRTTHIPGDPEQSLAGIIATQQQQSIVMAGLQEAVGQAAISGATMERNVGDLTRALENLRKLLQSDNGEQGLLFRTAMLEKGQVLMASQMKEHREEVSAHITTVEGKLDKLAQTNDEQLKEARDRSWKVTALVIGMLVNFLVGLLLLMLKH